MSGGLLFLFGVACGGLLMLFAILRIILGMHPREGQDGRGR